MRILITGAAGFVGLHLMKHLSQEHDVEGIDNFQHPVNPIVLSNEDRNIYNKVKYADCAANFLVAADFRNLDTIIHLAATINVDYSVEEPWRSIYNNDIGVLNVVDTCRQHDLKLVYASTCEVYGSNVYPKKPMSERHSLKPFSPYGASKLAGEIIIQSFIDSYGIQANILRPFNIFGPYQRFESYGGAIGIFTRKALQGHPPEIFGDGLQTRDYTYIDDVVAAYQISLEKGFDEPLNFGSQREIKILDLAKLICELCGRPNLQPVHVAPRVREVRHSWCNASRAGAKLNWRPKIPLELGLQEYIEWMKQTRVGS